MRYQFHGLHFTFKRREYFGLVDDRMDFGVNFCAGFLSSRRPTDTLDGMMLRTSRCIGHASRYPSSPSGLGVWFWLILVMSSHRLLVCNEADVGRCSLTVSTIRLRVPDRDTWTNNGQTHTDLRHPPGGRGLVGRSRPSWSRSARAASRASSASRARAIALRAGSRAWGARRSCCAPAFARSVAPLSALRRSVVLERWSTARSRPRMRSARPPTRSELVSRRCRSCASPRRRPASSSRPSTWRCSASPAGRPRRRRALARPRTRGVRERRRDRHQRRCHGATQAPSLANRFV